MNGHGLAKTSGFNNPIIAEHMPADAEGLPRSSYATWHARRRGSARAPLLLLDSSQPTN